jgi:hypothetical protein
VAAVRFQLVADQAALRNESDADVLFLVVSAPKPRGDRVDV